MDSQLYELRLDVGIDVFEEDYFLFRFLGRSIFALIAVLHNDTIFVRFGCTQIAEHDLC
jgi:hypothetical protein